MADQGNEGLFSPYLRAKRVHAAKPYLRGRVLDYGCGSGSLASLVDSQMYLGVEIDRFSLSQARSKHPDHFFIPELPDSSIKFDTVVSLAVIEHADCKVDFLQSLASRLANLPSARIIITTPHPAIDCIHGLGAAIGLFSRHAYEEHRDLLDRQMLENFGKNAGLTLESYSRFLFGTNQIAIYSRTPA